MNRTEIIIFRSPVEAFWYDNPMLALYLIIGLACLTCLIIFVSWIVSKYKQGKCFYLDFD